MRGMCERSGERFLVEKKTVNRTARFRLESFRRFAWNALLFAKKKEELPARATYIHDD